MKTKLKYIAILIFLLFSINVFSQQCQWAKHIGSTGIDDCNIVLDNQDNIYAAGSYYKLFPLTKDTLVSTGNNDLFLIKYDANGNEIWARTIGGLNPFSINFWEYLERGGGLKYDSSDNSIYINGIFYSTLVIDNFQVTSHGARDFFLAKFNLDGECLWLKSAGGINDERDCQFTLDENSDIYWYGNINGSGFVDTNIFSNNTFICKIAKDGTIQWIKQIINGGDIINSVVNENNIYFIALFSGSVTIDTITLSCINDFDFVIGKYNLINDQIQWVKQLSGGNSYENNATGMSLGNNSTLYIYCTFHDSLDLLDTTLYTLNHNTNILYLGLDTTGQINWIQQCPTLDTSYWAGGNIIELSDSSLYFAGSINSKTIFGSDTIDVNHESAYITHINKNGNFIGTIVFGEARNSGLKVFSNGSFVVCGNQTGTTKICDTSFTNFPGELAGMDNYIAKFDAITGLQNIIKPNNNKLLIYANPTSGLCNISIPTEFEHEKNLILYVYDQQGRLLKQASVEMDEERIRLNMEALAKGMYTAVLSNGKKQFSGKIIFQ